MQGPHVATKRPYWKHPNSERARQSQLHSQAAFFARSLRIRKPVTQWEQKLLQFHLQLQAASGEVHDAKMAGFNLPPLFQSHDFKKLKATSVTAIEMAVAVASTRCDCSALRFDLCSYQLCSTENRNCTYRRHGPVFNNGGNFVVVAAASGSAQRATNANTPMITFQL